MIFLGTTFCSGRYSLHPPSIKIPIVLSIQVFDGVYNHIFLSTNMDITIGEAGWTTGTILNADFTNGLDAGNSFFNLTNTDHVVIRRRELGTQKWTVVYVQKVMEIKDFKIRFKDTYARAGVEYEYSVSSYLNGVENNYIIQNVYSDFGGFYITDKDCLYGTIYNIDNCDTSRNINSQTMELLNSKYINVVSNSNANYESGQITGTFLKMDMSGYKVDQNATIAYRNQFKDRLSNKKPLILKIEDGRIWMIHVVQPINDTCLGHKDLREINFSWVEIGDINDMRTLYMNGFSDVDSRWWN